MAEWFELAAWIVALAMIHEGVAQNAQVRRTGLAKTTIGLGVLILLLGAGLWHWSARAQQRLADTLYVPPVSTQAALKVQELEQLPMQQRKEMSIKLAKAAFVNGEKLLNVVTEEGLRIPYSPSADDVDARDRQLKLLAEAESRRQGLIGSAEAATQQAKRWLVSLFIAIGTGFVAGCRQAGRKTFG